MKRFHCQSSHSRVLVVLYQLSSRPATSKCLDDLYCAQYCYLQRIETTKETTVKGPAIRDFELQRNDGSPFPLSSLEGKTLLIVNTASRCGFTPQYKGLEALHKEFKDRGLVVIGVPCDQFAHQEPGNDAEIAAFCERNFGVSFPLMSKVEVNGPGAHPLFVALRRQAPGLFGNSIKWNFTKFLVSPKGQVRRFAPSVEPAAMRKGIEKTLSA